MTPVTQEDLTTQSDVDLERRLGAAVLDGDVDTQRAVMHERERRTLQPLAEAEARRREADVRAAEAEALLTTLVAMRDDLKARYLAALDRLAVTPPSAALSLCEEVHTLGRQTYALSNDLVNATGDRYYGAGRYDVTDQIELHGGRTGHAFVGNMRGRAVTVPTPWRDDINRLVQLRTIEG